MGPAQGLSEPGAIGLGCPTFLCPGACWATSGSCFTRGPWRRPAWAGPRQALRPVSSSSVGLPSPRGRKPVSLCVQRGLVWPSCLCSQRRCRTSRTSRSHPAGDLGRRGPQALRRQARRLWVKQRRDAVPPSTPVGLAPRAWAAREQGLAGARGPSARGSPAPTEEEKRVESPPSPWCISSSEGVVLCIVKHFYGQPGKHRALSRPRPRLAPQPALGSRPVTQAGRGGLSARLTISSCQRGGKGWPSGR